MSGVVIDASVAIKWHVLEVHSDAARRFLNDDAPELHVPDLAYPELGNVLWKKIRRGELSEGQGREIARLLAATPWTVHSSAPYFESALEIALSTGRTVYDSLYLALAVALKCALVTADEKFYNAVKGLRDARLSAQILWIEDPEGCFIAQGARDDIGDIVISHIPAEGISITQIELEFSYFTGDRLTDEDLTQVQGLNDLQELYLTNPAISDAGLAHLSGLASLETLYLRGTRVGDFGLASLSGLANLKTLNLADTQVTDAGLVHLKGMVRLETLVLWGTSISDAGLVHLRGLAQLQELDVEGTRVTDTGVHELHQALPALKIIR